MKKNLKTSTKERLVGSAIELFRSKGFSGTGLKELVSNADAPWGSLYHFFPDGKEQLGAEVVEIAGREDNQQFQLAFAKTQRSTLPRLGKYSEQRPGG